MKKIFSERAPKPVGPYSQAILVNGFLFISGQLGIDPEKNSLVQSGFKDEARQALKNIHEIAKEAGADLKDAVKFEVFLADITRFKEFNEIYVDFLGQGVAPARQVVEVSALPLDAQIEISAIFNLK